MSAAPRRSAPLPPPPNGHEEEHEEEEGAPAHERLVAAAKSDNESMFEEAIAAVQDVNYTDGLGNTALHYAIQNASTSILEPLLENETCDVDLRNRLNGDTPLHLAVKQRWEEHEGLRLYLVEQLLEAGANTSIKNRHNLRPVDLLPPASIQADPESDDEQVRAAIRRAEAEAFVADKGDVVDDDDDIIDPNDVASDSD